MFGVDQYGNDVLAPQFSKSGDTGPQKIIRPGSITDLDIATGDYYNFLSTQPRIREAALKATLLNLYQQGVVRLKSEDLTNAKKSIIDRELERNENLRIRVEEQRALIISQNALISGPILGALMREDEAIKMHVKKKEQVTLASTYNETHPEVIELALLNAYRKGDFKSITPTINQGIENIIRKIAIERAKQAAAEMATVASRSGVMRVAEL